MKSRAIWTPLRLAVLACALMALLAAASLASGRGDPRQAAAGVARATPPRADAQASAHRRRHRCRRGYVRRRVHRHWKCVRRHHKKPATHPPAVTPPLAPTPGALPGTGTTPGDGTTPPPAGGGTTPPQTPTPPPPIAGQGYHEAFDDEFDTLDRSVWDDHIWYDESPYPSWAPTEYVSDGILHLVSRRNDLYTGCSANCYPISTITTQTSDKTFQYGYFEARMKWSAGDGAWPGFWLYSYQHAIDQNQCTTQAGEIDVMEGQGSEPDVFYGTVHSNTNGCAPADDQNGNNYQPVGVDLTAGFHTYGVLWTSTTVSWYLDDKLVMSAPTYATDNQRMFVLLQMWSGGWTTDPDPSTPDSIETQVDWVRVWTQ